jgi:hypothetical protein
LQFGIFLQPNVSHFVQRHKGFRTAAHGRRNTASSSRSR